MRTLTTIPLALMATAIFSSIGCNIRIGDFDLKKGVRGNGVVATEERSIGDFDSIDVHGVIQLEVSCNSDPSLTIEGEDNLLPIIQTNCKDGHLVIRSTEPYNSTKPIIVKVSCSKLQGYEGHGATEGKVSAVESESMQISLSGASTLVIQAGKVNSLKAELSGASTLNTKKLDVANAEITASGASKAIVKVEDELTVEASGVSSVVNETNANTVNKELSGMATLEQAK